MDFIHRYIPSQTHQPHDTTTLVLLHGTGGNEDDLIALGQFLSTDANLLSLRGKVSEEGMLRFFRRLAEGVFDEEDLIFRTHELAHFIRDAVQEYDLNENRLVAVGYSNGANIAASEMLLEPDVFSAAILLRAMIPLKPEALPNLTGRRVLMQSGKVDPLIAPDKSQLLADMLKDAGADVTLNWQDTGHGLTTPEFHTAQRWLHSIL